MELLRTKIDGLSDQESLGILQMVSAEAADASAPQTDAEVADLLKQLFRQAEANFDVDLARIELANRAAAGRAAGRLLDLIAVSPSTAPQGRASLQELASSPPVPETASPALILGGTVVLTGCVAILQLVGHVRFTRNAEGKITIDYDPARRTPFDSHLTTVIQALAAILEKLSR